MGLVLNHTFDQALVLAHKQDLAGLRRLYPSWKQAAHPLWNLAFAADWLGLKNLLRQNKIPLTSDTLHPVFLRSSLMDANHREWLRDVLPPGEVNQLAQRLLRDLLDEQVGDVLLARQLCYNSTDWQSPQDWVQCLQWLFQAKRETMLPTLLGLAPQTWEHDLVFATNLWQVLSWQTQLPLDFLWDLLAKYPITHYPPSFAYQLSQTAQQALRQLPWDNDSRAALETWLAGSL